MEAARALGRLGSESDIQLLRDTLIRLLKDPESSVRKYACDIIEDLGPIAATEGTLDALISRLNDSDSLVQTRACRALATFGASAASALPMLSLLARARDSYVRRAAKQATSKL